MEAVGGPRALKVLTQGQEILHEIAAGISDVELRRTFLNRACSKQVAVAFNALNWWLSYESFNHQVPRMNYRILSLTFLSAKLSLASIYGVLVYNLPVLPIYGTPYPGQKADLAIDVPYMAQF